MFHVLQCDDDVSLAAAADWNDDDDVDDSFIRCGRVL